MPPPIIIMLTFNHCIIRHMETSKRVARSNSRYCIAQQGGGKERSHVRASPKNWLPKDLVCHLFGAHAAEKKKIKKSTKQLSALSSIFMISWILSLTCTFGRFGGHVILMCFPDISKRLRFQGGFNAFRNRMVQTRGSKTQHCYVSALNVCNSANHNIAMFRHLLFILV